MGCWEHGKTKNIVCDGPCDVIGELIGKKYGKINVHDPNYEKKNREIFKKIMGDKKTFMSLYNKVRKNFVQAESAENERLDEEYSMLIRSGTFDKTREKRDAIQSKITFRDMTVREFVCHLEFCTLSGDNNIKIPAFASAIDKQQQQELQAVEEQTKRYKQEHPTTLAGYMLSPKKGGGLFTISVGVNKSSYVPQKRKSTTKRTTTRKRKAK